MSSTSSPLTSLTTSPKTWDWKGYPICYQNSGQQGPAVVLIHGFGASWGHWRKNLPVLGETCSCYALDLIGFGSSAKPRPGREINYTFETWGQQVADFCREVVALAHDSEDKLDAVVGNLETDRAFRGFT